MKIGVLCIGDELLKGAVVNTNLAYMGQKLLELGIVPELSLEVPDRPEDAVWRPVSEDVFLPASARCRLPLRFWRRLLARMRGACLERRAEMVTLERYCDRLEALYRRGAAPESGEA